MQDAVDPVKDEMLAKFVVDSHFKSQPKGGYIDDKSIGCSQDEMDEVTNIPTDTEVCTTGLKLIVLLMLESLFEFVENIL